MCPLPSLSNSASRQGRDPRLPLLTISVGLTASKNTVICENTVQELLISVDTDVVC